MRRSSRRQVRARAWLADDQCVAGGSLYGMRMRRDDAAARQSPLCPRLASLTHLPPSLAAPSFPPCTEYFRIRLIRLPVGADYRLSGAAVARAIGPNTVLVVASAPGFPHGVMDHVADIAKVRLRPDVWMVWSHGLHQMAASCSPCVWAGGIQARLCAAS